jgi:hypothetical protein
MENPEIWFEYGEYIKNNKGKILSSFKVRALEEVVEPAKEVKKKIKK